MVVGSGLSLAENAPSTSQDQAKQIWQLLDYLAVDYGKAVQNGQIASADEYREMQEFAREASRQLEGLPPTSSTKALRDGTGELRTAIANKAQASVVAEQARHLADALLLAYPVQTTPTNTPDIKLGGRLYANQCAACHGISGRADGPLASQLNPPPIAFADHTRARERSVFALQQIITRGVPGTSMPSFAKLTDDDRWALAYFVSTMSYTKADRDAGAKLWAEQPALHAAVPTLGALGQSSEAGLAKHLGDDTARSLLAFLRNSPELMTASSADSLALAKAHLKQSVTALGAGNRAEASRLALSAYLDGFEPVEPALAAKNAELFHEVENLMGQFRNAAAAGQLEQARQIESKLQNRLDTANEALSGTNDPMSTFLGALTILLREGLEALLVVVAMLAFLKKANRKDALPYVHAGWITALAMGGFTWAVATYLVNVSGASREMTEGFSAIFAAVVLLAVGIWMHQKSLAGRWQAYVQQKLSAALNGKSMLMLFLLAFVTVYREVFETVLFYAALWTEENGGYLLAGLGLGIAILAGIAAILLRSSARLPISQFFAASSALVGILAVVLIGKGAAALQKVGLIPDTPVSLPRIEVLGVYPSLQPIAAQLLILVVIIASITYNLRSQPRRA
ncbi:MULTISPECIES: cytochrome c/FTR1 family iron permease [Massilia]|uniref:cytochrome c/FTR1 family iron permease n=1 Tax=Massilia TaxID=149698 RepID=UPI000D6970DA|nr:MULTISPECIES: cytochrome c/FTR1 family iron permease [Massilia]